MSENQVHTNPAKIGRLLRGELASRWQIQAESLASIDVRRDALIRLLQDHFGFARRRATVEVDEFLSAFDDKLRRATETAVRPVSAA